MAFVKTVERSRVPEEFDPWYRDKVTLAFVDCPDFIVISPPPKSKLMFGVRVHVEVWATSI